MKQADQVQKVVDEFHRESSLRQSRFQKTLIRVLLPFFLAGFVYGAVLSYLAGHYYRALIIASIGVFLLIAGLWFPPKKPLARPSAKERLSFWVPFVIYTFGFWLLDGWL